MDPRAAPVPMDPRSARIPIVVSADDDQHDMPVDGRRWASLAEAVLADLGVEGPGEATLLFVDRDTMTDLNRMHMGGEGPTDVLSFPIDSDDRLHEVDHRLVGDVVICPSVAAANAPSHAGDVEGELALLVVHGVLHLLGHDHRDTEERSAMWDLERGLLARHFGQLRRDPWRSAGPS